MLSAIPVVEYRQYADKLEIFFEFPSQLLGVGGTLPAQKGRPCPRKRSGLGRTGMEISQSPFRVSPRFKSLHATHSPDVTSLWPEAIKQDPLSIRRPDGVVDPYVGVGEFVHHLRISARHRRNPQYS